jgi:hypothetical protein
MTIEEFCIKVATLDLSQWQQAVAILWYHDRKQPDVVMSAGQLAKIIHETGLGVPHSTQLGRAILRSGLVLSSTNGFRLKSLSRATVSDWLQEIMPPATEETATTPVANKLASLVSRVLDPAERSFIVESITCINHSAPRAAIVLGWCAAVHRMRRKVEALGFPAFNAASTQLKNQTTGKYKRWNKEFAITSFGELQTTVFDTDLIVVLESMGLLDGTQTQRLETCFEYRCHSAHPGDAPIEEPHVVAFFNDIIGIVLSNPKFA